MCSVAGLRYILHVVEQKRTKKLPISKRRLEDYIDKRHDCKTVRNILRFV